MSDTAGVKLEIQGLGAFVAGYQQATAAQTAFGASSTETAKRVAQIASAAGQLRLDKIGDQLATQTRQLMTYQAELRKLEAAGQGGSAAAQKLASAIEGLKTKIDRGQQSAAIAAAKLEVLAQREAEAGKETQALGGDVVKLSGDITSSGRSFSAFGEVATGAFRKVGEMAVSGLAAGVAALGDFAKGSIGAAGDFESGMGRFAAVAGDIDAAGLSLDQFSAKFLQLGADTQFSAAQAQDAAIELVKGGVSITDVMNGATEATLNLAAAGELDLAQAAEIVAKQLGVWGEAAGGAANVTDLLAQAANASTVNVDDLAVGMANVGGVAKAAGLSLDETVSTIGLIAPGFSSAADAGTSFKVLLGALQPQTKTAIGAFRELGLLTEQGTSAFYDAQGSFVGMTEATRLLAAATTDLSEADKSRLLRLAFGQDAQRAAIALAEQGATGYQAFGAAMDAQGTAAEQAEKRNQGFNFAMETLRGSVETAQIVLGQKLLPVLTAVVEKALIPAVNAVTTFAQGIDGIGDVVDAALPVVGGLTAALVAYEISALAATTTTGGLAIGMALATQNAIAAAASFAAVAAPLALIAVSVGGVIKAVESYNESVDNAEANTLLLATGYQRAGESLDQFREKQADLAYATDDQRAAIAGEALILTHLRGELERATSAYYAVGGGTQENYDRMIQLNEALKQHSTAYNAAVTGAQNSIAANKDHATAVQEGRDKLLEFKEAQLEGAQSSADLAGAVQLSDEAVKAFEKTLEDVSDKGPGVFDKVVQGEVDYRAKVEEIQAAHNDKMDELADNGNQDLIDKQVEAYTTQMENAGIAYAEQQAAQRAHLGQMLIDYAVAQGQLNGVSQEKIAEMTAGLADAYGVQRSLSDTTFGEMTGDIDAWAASGGENSRQVVSDLDAAGDAAVETQRQMDALAKEYRAELIQNFKDGKIDADQLADALAKIPSRVNSEVRINTTYTQSGTPPPTGGYSGRATGNNDQTQYRAGGGRYEAMRPLITGEDGPELQFPDRPGYVMDASKAAQLIRASQQRSMLPTGGGPAWAVGAEVGGGLAEGMSMGAGEISGAISRPLEQAITVARTSGRTIAAALRDSLAEIGHSLPALSAMNGSVRSGVGAGRQMLAAPAWGQGAGAWAPPASSQPISQIVNHTVSSQGPTISYAPTYNAPAPPPAMSYAALSALAGV